METCHILARPLTTSTDTMELVRAERKQGNSVHVICPQAPDASPIGEVNGAVIHEVRAAAVTRFSPSLSLAFLRQVHAVIRRHQFDAVLVYKFRGCGLLPLVARGHGRVWLATIRASNTLRTDLRATLADYLTRRGIARYSR